MPRVHGKDVRVYLGTRDASGDLSSIDMQSMVETHDRTVFNNVDWKSFDPGLFSWTASFDAFYQPDAGGIGRQLEAVGDSFILSVYDGDADGVGDAGYLGSAGVLQQRGQPMSVGDLIKLSGSLTGSGRAAPNGRLLHPLATRTTGANGTSYDNSASSANGGRGNLHVTTYGSGTWTLKVQHSADNSTFADLITFSSVTGLTSETAEVSGTVNRYLRATWSGTGSAAFVIGFGRY